MQPPKLTWLLVHMGPISWEESTFLKWKRTDEDKGKLVALASMDCWIQPLCEVGSSYKYQSTVGKPHACQMHLGFLLET